MIQGLDYSLRIGVSGVQFLVSFGIGLFIKSFYGMVGFPVRCEGWLIIHRHVLPVRHTDFQWKLECEEGINNRWGFRLIHRQGVQSLLGQRRNWAGDEQGLITSTVIFCNPNLDESTFPFEGPLFVTRPVSSLPQ